MSLDTCPLCKSGDISLFHKDDYGTHYRCRVCKLISTDPADLPSPEEEKERYDTHENDPNDPDYRGFLSQLFDPLNKRLEPRSKGLDFGSGPGPTLSVMFEEEGHTVNLYDPFYAFDPGVFEEEYDFITSTETFEHLHHPGKEIDRLWNCLKPGGYLGVMTKLAGDHNQFADWHYKKDLTHVTFFTEDTFRWLADHLNASVEFPDDRVIILQKCEN